MTQYASVSWDLAPARESEALPRQRPRIVQPHEAERGNTVFGSPAYREIYDRRHVLSTEHGEQGCAPLLFDDRGDHAVCLARTAALDEDAIIRTSETLFQLDRLRFLVFEDVHLAAGGGRSFGSLRFRYQNDWVLPLGAGAGMAGSFCRRMDQKLRRLRRKHDGIELEIVPSPRRELVERAIRLSREKIEAGGTGYLIDDREQDRLARLFRAIGTAAVLRHEDHVVSVDLFVEHGGEAYAFLGGYDASYAKASPGLLTIRHGVEHFGRRGFQRVHFLWGDGAYKAELGAVRNPLSTLVVPRNAAAWRDGRFLAQAARFGLLDIKRRIKERSEIARPLHWAVKAPRHLATILKARA